MGFEPTTYWLRVSCSTNWSYSGKYLVIISATNNEKEKVVKVESDELADDHSKRSTYENEELKNSDL